MYYKFSMDRKSLAEVPYLNVTEDGKIRRIPINQILYVSVIKRGAIVHQYSNGDDKESSMNSG